MEDRRLPGPRHDDETRWGDDEAAPDRRVLAMALAATVAVVVLLAAAMSGSPSGSEGALSADATVPPTLWSSTTDVPATATTQSPVPPPLPTSVPAESVTATEPTTVVAPVPLPALPAPSSGAPVPPVGRPSTAAVATAGGGTSGTRTTAAAAFCLGDSVMFAGSPAGFGTLSMCREVDAVGGRRAPDAAAELATHGPLPDTVVVHVGTSGAVTGGELDAILGRLTGVRRVVLVNVQLNGRRSWEASANAEIAAAARRWPGVHLADWRAASAGHPEWFRDGIHLTAAGADAYAAVIAAAL